MEVHTPKSPPHGWRAFLKEYLIIVIGVLTALAAEQAAEAIRWQHHIRQAKEDFDSELQAILGSAQERVRFKDCYDRQLDRLEELIAQPPPNEINLGRFGQIRTWQTAAWESAVASGAIEHMAPKERILYAKIYSVIRFLHEENRDEANVGLELGTRIGGKVPLNDLRKDQLASSLAKRRSYNSVMAAGAVQLSEMITSTGIKLSESQEAGLNHPCRMPDEPAD